MDTRTLDDGWIEMPRLLMEMVQEYAAMTERQQRRVVGQLIVEKIHTVGHTESPRELRRLHYLREWSHEQDE